MTLAEPLALLIPLVATLVVAVGLDGRCLRCLTAPRMPPRLLAHPTPGEATAAADRGRRRRVARPRQRARGERLGAVLGPLPDQRGVTLIELMVVVAIIAIIAAIAVSIFQDASKKARLAADTETVAAMRSGIAIYYGRTNGNLPPDRAAVNSLLTPFPVYQCTVLPTYDSGNGKVSYTATIADCP